MASGNSIIVSSQPRGVFKEGKINTGRTPKPGTIMVLVRGTAKDGNGRFTYEEYGVTASSGAQGVSADGDRENWFVLLEDRLQSKGPTDAYAADDVCFLYRPAPGEEINVLFKDVTGTGTNDEIDEGEKLTVDDGTGKLIRSNGTVEIEPFVALEALTDVTADTLLHCQATGH